ncbi:MAG TPA: hypothetical protein VFE48_25630 [Methylomirabilota bacterium]|nr:hypothetical protein [Methylomirabilota bacterium]
MRSGRLAEAAGEAIVVARLPAHDDPSAPQGHEADAVLRTNEERRRVPRRVVMRAGRELILLLPPGEALAPGRPLHVGAGWYVTVEVASEPPLAVLLVPDEPPRERLLTRLDVPWTRVHAPFVPIGPGSPR